MLLALALLAAPPAAAQQCPWEVVESVAATRNFVVINGDAYPVKAAADRVGFQHLLMACHQDEAAVYFDAWSHHKRITNVTLLSGLLAPWLWVGSGVYALLSSGHKALLLDAMMKAQPPRDSNREAALWGDAAQL